MQRNYREISVPGYVESTIEPPTKMKANRPSSVVLILIFLLIACGLTLVTLWYWPRSPKRMKADEPAAAAFSNLPISRAEDLRHHLDAALVDAIKAAEETKRSRSWLGRLLPALDRNYMGLERGRAENADGAARSSQRYIEQLREQIEIAKGILGGTQDNENHEH